MSWRLDIIHKPTKKYRLTRVLPKPVYADYLNKLDESAILTRLPAHIVPIDAKLCGVCRNKKATYANS